MKLYRSIKLSFSLSLILLLIGTSGLHSAIKPPEDTVKKLLTTIQQLKTEETLKPDAKVANAKTQEQALGFLNVSLVSQKTLGKYWKKRSKLERIEFTKLLSELFKKVAFQNSAKFFKELKLDYQEAFIDGTLAEVPVLVIHDNEGEVAIDFQLEQQKDSWKVVDVLLDGVSMRNNLRNQFYKIIKKYDYPELVKRMREKLASVNEDKPAPPGNIVDLKAG